MNHRLVAVAVPFALAFFTTLTPLHPLGQGDGNGLAFVAAAHAEDTWRTELEDLCGRSNDSMTFSREQLSSLIERCDRLKPRIEALDESARKVYGKRLKMCRDFYAFMLEGKTQEVTKPKEP